MLRISSRFRAIDAAMLLALVGTQALGQFPADLMLNELDGTDGFTVVGHLTGEFGGYVAGIGDVNADGIDDVGSGNVGVHFPDQECGGGPFGGCPDCDPTPGAVFVLFGGPDVAGDGSWNTRRIDGSNGFRIEGINVNEGAGYVSPAGDFNDDGIDDFLTGGPSASPGGMFLAGRAYLIYGAPGLGETGAFDPATLNGANGFIVTGGFSWAGIGRRMAALGDFNDDGVSDVAFSAIGADLPGRPDAGQVYILFGGTDAGESGMFVLPDSITPQLGIKINGISEDNFTGAGLAAAGDFNGDGVDDIVIGASGVEPEPLARGQSYVVYGGSDVGEFGVFELADLDGTNGFVINGPPGEGGPTTTGPATGVGDINDDGYADIGVQVNSSNDWIGVIFGGPDVAPDGVFCLEDLNGDNGFKLLFSGSPVLNAGDLNHDGIDDLLAGMVAVFGLPGIGASGVVEFADIHDGQHGVWLRGQFIRGRGHAGDVNDDGIDDVVIGQELYNDDGCDMGRIHIVFGRRMGDGDLDADIDLADFGQFQVCFGQPPDGDVPDQCHPFDFDKDNDIDLNDCAEFETLFGTTP